MEPELLTFQETAAKLGVHKNTVYAMVDANELATVTVHKMRKIRRADVDALIAGEKPVAPTGAGDGK